MTGADEYRLSNAQRALKRRLERLVTACRKAGLCVVADAGQPGIRLIPLRALVGNASDVRGLGEVVEVDDACGGAILNSRGPNGEV